MANSKADDAIELLKADHKKVLKMFKDYEKQKDSASAADKSDLATSICLEITVHSMLEEEIFYPAARNAIDDDDLMDEAAVEHAGAKDLIDQLQEMEPDDDLYDAKVTVLGEEIRHHVEEEEKEMFPKVKKARVDIDQLGRQMSKRKEVLFEELGGVAADD
jgi:hemerythrin superfamily protein